MGCGTAWKLGFVLANKRSAAVMRNLNLRI
jgi:hypothetical protein